MGKALDPLVDLQATVKYRWVPRDQENARRHAPTAPPTDAKGKWRDYQDRQLTPYGFTREMLPGCEKYSPGDPVAVNLGASFLYRMEVNRFAEFPGDVEWLPISEEDVAGCATLGELCDKLLADGSDKLAAKYGGLYDAFKVKDASSEEARRKLCRAIFDHWDNTDLRHAVITSGKFDWTDCDKQPWAQPTQASAGGVSYRIMRVPTRAPRHKRVSAASGTQVVVAPDEEMNALEGDLRWIRVQGQRIGTLLEQSRIYLRERAELAQHLTMTRVMLEMSATGAGDNIAEVRKLAATAKELEAEAARAAREVPLAELVDARTRKGAPSGSVVAAIRAQLGYVDDIAAELEKTGKRLAARLLDDTAFAARMERWGSYVIEKKLHETPAFQAWQVKISTVFVDAILALTETALSDAHAATIDATLASIPDVGLVIANVLKAPANAVAKFAATVGKLGVWAGVKEVNREYDVLRRGAAVSGVLGNAFGNLAGPPSIWIAWVQYRSWKAFHAKIQEVNSVGTFDSEMHSFVDGVVKLLDEKGAPMKPSTKEAFNKAMVARDPAQLDAIKRDVLDELSGSLQAGAGAKTLALLPQLIVLAWAYADYFGKEKKDREVLNLVGLVVGTTATVPMVLDWGATSVAATFGRMSELAWLPAKLAVVSASLQKCGMTLGVVSGVLGAYASLKAGHEADLRGEHFREVVNYVGAAGNVTVAFACGAWMAGMPIPGWNGIGLALVVGSAIVIFILDEVEKSKTALSRVGGQLLDRVELDAFYDTVCLRGDFMAKLGKIRRACEAGNLPLARNHPDVIRALTEAGFRPDVVRVMVEAPSAPFFQANLPTAG